MRSDEPTVIGLDTCTDHCVHPQTVRHVQSRALPAADLTRVAAVFKLVGDPTRAKLLYALLEAGELCVCDLAAATGTQEATVSQSLRLLRASQVVAARRDGRLMYYRLADAHVRMLLDLTREHITHEDTHEHLVDGPEGLDPAVHGPAPRAPHHDRDVHERDVHERALVAPATSERDTAAGGPPKGLTGATGSLPMPPVAPGVRRTARAGRPAKRTAR